MTRDDVHMAVFGSFDGLTSAVGVVFAAILTQSDVFTVAFALAVAATASMAAGEWLSDDAQDANRGRRATVMGASTFVGSLTPALAYVALSGTTAAIVATAVVLLLSGVIAEIRPGPRFSSYCKTLGVLAVASALAVGAALLGQVVAG